MDPSVFRTTCSHLGDPDMDLFASRVSNQLKNYMSWKPDPLSSAPDAFTQNWGNLFSYAFPPFSLIGRTLKKVKKKKINDQINKIVKVIPNIGSTSSLEVVI